MKKEIKLINELDPEKIDLPRDLPGTVLLQEKKFGSRTLFFDYARFLYGQGTMSNSVLCRTVEPGQGMLRLAGEAEIVVLNGFLPENLRKVMSYDYINHWKSTGINLGLFLEILFADEEKRKLPRKMRNSQRFDRAMRVVNLSPNTAENRLDLYKRLYATVPAHEAAHFKALQLFAIEKRMRDLEDLKLLHQQWGKDTGEDDKLYAFWDQKYRNIARVLYSNS